MLKVTRYLFSLVLCCNVTFFILAGVLYLVQYGPVAVYGFIGGLVAIAFFLNNARKHQNIEWITGGVSRERREKAIERYVEEVKVKNDDAKAREE